MQTAMRNANEQQTRYTNKKQKNRINNERPTDRPTGATTTEDKKKKKEEKSVDNNRRRQRLTVDEITMGTENRLLNTNSTIDDTY